MNDLASPIFVEPEIRLKPRSEWGHLMRCRICRQLSNTFLQPVRPLSEETFICGACVGNWSGRTGTLRFTSRRDQFNILKIKALAETLRWSSINGPLP